MQAHKAREDTVASNAEEFCVGLAYLALEALECPAVIVDSIVAKRV